MNGIYKLSLDKYAEEFFFSNQWVTEEFDE